MPHILRSSILSFKDDDRDLPANPDLFDFAKKRLALGEALFYKILEAILTLEHNTTSKPLNNFSVSLRQEQFQRSLFASCLEIVMLSYNSKETLFPWILNVFGLKGYDYYRIIEPVIRSEQQLSRDVVKHFNRVGLAIFIMPQIMKGKEISCTSIKVQFSFKSISLTDKRKLFSLITQVA